MTRSASLSYTNDMAQRPAIHVRLHPTLYARLVKESEKQHLDRSAIVTLALNEHFARLDGERGRR